MTLRVAIASEYDQYDGEIFRFLIGSVLGTEVEKWTGEFSFNGYKSVAKLAPAFLSAASGAGVRHALLAVDNDGGLRRRPEHDDAHIPAPFAITDDDSCRECWLTASAPASWAAGAGRLCIVVPVQAVETWLLVLRGDTFAGAPEASYDRSALKKRFFGRPHPPVASRIAKALEHLRRPDAIGVLRRLRRKPPMALVSDPQRTGQTSDCCSGALW